MSNELTFYDRQKLQYWLRTKQSLRKIAGLMQKDHSVLSREIKRNGSYGRKGYRADTAQRLFENRRHKQRRSKMEKYPKLKEYVLLNLREGWSPEEIAGRLKGTKTDVTVSHESIYQYIYNRAKRWEQLPGLLPQRRPKRRKWGGRKTRKMPIPQRISIKFRPRVVDLRKRFGDWESDNLEFRRTLTDGAVSVQCERKSGLLRLHKVAGRKSPEDTLNAIVMTMESLPCEMAKTITFDNGIENYKHTDLKEMFDVETYFCRPFASWQKGSVENANKLLRRYLPKNTDLDILTNQDLYLIQEKINNRPRKRLGYKTPNEVINDYLKVVH